MPKLLTDKYNLLLEFIKTNSLLSSKEIHTGLQAAISYTTIKRILQKLISENLITVSGQGKGTKYQLSQAYELLYPIDTDKYFEKEIDERKIKESFNHSLLTVILNTVPIFTDEELTHLIRFKKDTPQMYLNLAIQHIKKNWNVWLLILAGSHRR